MKDTRILVTLETLKSTDSDGLFLTGGLTEVVSKAIGNVTGHRYCDLEGTPRENHTNLKSDMMSYYIER